MKPVLDHLVPIEECILFAPLDTLDIPMEPLRAVPTVVRTHATFMAERNQAGWLAWNITRPLPIHRHKARPMAVARPSLAALAVAMLPTQRDTKGRFTRRDQP